VPSPATVIKDLLVSAGIGTFAATTGWAIYVSREPAQADNVPHSVITCYDSGGLKPNPQWLLDEPTVQVMVRGNPNGYEAAYTKCQDVKNALLGLPSQTIGADRWVSISMLSDIAMLGYSEQNQPMLSLNFKLIIEPASGTNRTSL